jgi:hypothetical protein
MSTADAHPRDDALIPVESEPVAIPSAPEVPISRTADTAAPALAFLAGLPPETQALLEMIGRGLSPEADVATRATARELWVRLAESLATAPPLKATTPGIPLIPGALPMPGAPAMPWMPTVAQPNTPIAMAAHALKRMTPDQLIDLVLQRLRAALPAGSTFGGALRLIHFRRHRGSTLVAQARRDRDPPPGRTLGG